MHSGCGGAVTPRNNTTCCEGRRDLKAASKKAMCAQRTKLTPSLGTLDENPPTAFPKFLQIPCALLSLPLECHATYHCVTNKQKQKKTYAKHFKNSNNVFCRWCSYLHTTPNEPRPIILCIEISLKSISNDSKLRCA